MNIVQEGDRLTLVDAAGNPFDLFASHRELIELAVFGNVLGNRDMPFDYEGQSTKVKEPDNSEMAVVNPNHSHYILIDDGSRGKFGIEVCCLYV